MQISRIKGGFHELLLAIFLLSGFFVAVPVLAEDETATTTPQPEVGQPLAEEIIVPIETPTTTPTPEPEPEQEQEPIRTIVNLNLRYQNSLIFSNQVILPTSTTIVDNNELEHFTTSTNVLTALLAADTTSADFRVSDLQYYDAYQSFYVNCIETTVTSTPLCANWNYVVNNTYPNVGMDKYLLSGDENIYVYFDNPWKITASTSTFPANTTTTLKTWRYNYDNLENEWTADANNLIDISVTNPNPTGWWDNTLTVATTTTDGAGITDCTFSTTGTFYAKITSSDYSKWSNPITLTVFDPPPTPTTTPTSTPPQDNTPPDNGGGGGGNNNDDESPANPTVSDADIKTAVDQILAYLKLQQDATSKIIDGGTTDWAIMSFGANGQYADELLNFAKTYNFTDQSDINVCAGYPRHILALLAGGVSTDDTLILNLKSKINSECYKDNLYGQTGINDDVFGVLALLAIGTNPSEPIVQTAINTIKADQTADGAFTWAGYAGTDITGAAINALKYAETMGATIDPLILTKAKTYLKTTQLEDGGWGFDTSDPMTTSWVMMGINMLGEKQADWTKNNKNPWHILTEKLSSNGYYEAGWAPGTVEWFATKHAVPALLGKPWPIILSPRATLPVTQPTGGSAQDTTPTPTTTTFVVTPTSTTPTIFTTSTIVTTTTPTSTDSNYQMVDNTTTTTFVATPTMTTTNTTHDSDNTTQNTLQVTSYKLQNKNKNQKPQNENLKSSILNLQSATLSPAPSKTSPEPTNPISSAAKKLFAGSSIAAGGLGLYLAWRFLQTIV